MFLFETILFYKGSPCFYKIYSKGENAYYCEAQPHFYYSHIPFPNFSVLEKDNNFETLALEDEDLSRQVIKDLQSFLEAA